MSATSRDAQLDARIPVSMGGTVIAGFIAGEQVAGDNQTGERWG
jgi:hypothetical protein